VATLNGSNGNDTLTGGPDPEEINGNEGDDVLSGGAGDDTIAGDFGHDQIDGGDGNDWLGDFNYVHDSETDTLTGGNGDDHLFASYGDVVDGGPGTDLLVLDISDAPSGVNLDLSVLTHGGSVTVGGGMISNVEYVGEIFLTAYDDNVTITGAPPGTFSPAMYGGDGNDTLNGSDARDSIFGGNGNDLIHGNGGTEPHVIGGIRRTQNGFVFPFAADEPEHFSRA